VPGFAHAFDRPAQAIRVFLKILQRGGLGADMPARERLCGSPLIDSTVRSSVSTRMPQFASQMWQVR
jgi:hypothetical protein